MAKMEEVVMLFIRTTGAAFDSRAAGAAGAAAG